MRGAAAALILLFSTPSAATETERIDAAFAGLTQYFGSETGYFESCGATGGNGGSTSPFKCKCETGKIFCTNCWRWWMAGGIQSLVDLNAAIHHPSRNATMALLRKVRATSPYTSRFDPSWAYIDDYMWYVHLWLRVHEATGDASYLHEAASTYDLMYGWGSDDVEPHPCGGIFWMFPDNGPHGARKNAITNLETLSAAAQLATAYRRLDTAKASRYTDQAQRLWAWLMSTDLISDAPLMQDNVSAVTGGGELLCCNGTSSGNSKLGGASARCEVTQGTTTWTYNQGMLLGAAVDMHALTGNASYLSLGASVLNATMAHLAVHGVLTEPASLNVTSTQCDANHDPSSPLGGDAFSFKMIFFVQLPRFVAAVAGADTLPTTQRQATLATARAIIAASSAAAWTSRVQPPFTHRDVCVAPAPAPPTPPSPGPTPGPSPGTCPNRALSQCGGDGWTGVSCCPPAHTCVAQNPYYSQCLPAAAGHAAPRTPRATRSSSTAAAESEGAGKSVGKSAPPRFTWDWAPAGSGLFCTDSRTQLGALSLFVSELLVNRTLVRWT